MLLFAGDQDFICNYVGMESLIQKMEWNGAQGLGVRNLRTDFMDRMTIILRLDGRDEAVVCCRGAGGYLGRVTESVLRQSTCSSSPLLPRVHLNVHSRYLTRHTWYRMTCRMLRTT